MAWFCSAVDITLGDNIFYGAGLSQLVRDTASKDEGRRCWPTGWIILDYGVVIFDPRTGAARKIEEKPAGPSSNWAVTGWYLYDNEVLDIAASIRPPVRGELDITDVKNVYLKRGRLRVRQLDGGYAWLDTGPHGSLHEASSFVRTIEHRQGMKIMCPKEIALELGYLTGEEVLARVDSMGKAGYAAYLRRPLGELAHG